MINDHGYDGNHINGIIDLNDKGICMQLRLLKLLRYAAVNAECLFERAWRSLHHTIIPTMGLTCSMDKL